MRRKITPLTLPKARRRCVALSPALPRGHGASIPTAAALALALAGIGCSTPLPLAGDAISPDPAASAHAAPVSEPPSPPASPSTSTSATKPIEPDPHDVDGGVGVVEPVPVSPVGMPPASAKASSLRRPS